jgi:uncharacterized protein (TIGR03067 family)
MRLLILLLVVVLGIGCSRQNTSGQTGMPPRKEPERGAQEDQKGLQGTWKVVSMFMAGGKTVPAERVAKADLKASISGQQWTMTRGGKLFEQATITVDPSKQPKAIDFAYTQGECKGQTVPGIYEVTRDTLRIAWTEPGKARATDFVCIGRGCGRMCGSYGASS